ncbi:MAG TPA: PLP-dependent aminotransferase family protein [Terriglobales bacterium]|nr:PLP-dependent aminotransferase family protein [Terriglobales bacterium]
MPLHRQIYDAYRSAIVGSMLQPGQRVPSTRGLAFELGISRIPVLTAYAQLLAEGYFQSRVGTGTVVSTCLPDQPLSPEPRRGGLTSDRKLGTLAKHARLLHTLENAPGRRGWGAFSVGQVAFDQFPFSIWNSLVTRHCRNTNTKDLDYGSPMGLQRLREAIAIYLRTSRGVRCDADQIAIVSGSQQALDICVRVLLEPGSQVWIEEPGYRFARNVFALNRCRVVPVPVDSEGLTVAVGIKQCRQARATLVTPSHQYPLGFTMSASRRLQLLDWADRARSWILEDDYDSEFRYENMPISSLQGLDSNGRVIYIGTFSKVLFPSLRLGYLVIPTELVERFRAVRLAMDIGPATFSQQTLADFIGEGHFSRHIRRMRLLYRERRNALLENLRATFGPTMAITGEQAGMHLCVMLNGIRDHDITQRAAREKLWLTPLSSCYAGKVSRQGFILGFGSTKTEEMPNAVGKLRAALGIAGKLAAA